jgi:hypothetical protein
MTKTKEEQIEIMWEALQAIALEEEEPVQLAVRAMAAVTQVGPDDE